MNDDHHDSDHLDKWADRLLGRDPIADEIVDTLEEEEIEEVACHPEVDWSTLRAQPDRDAAIRMFEHRVQALMESGDWATVIDDLDSTELERDAAKEPQLEAVVLRAVSAVAWFDPSAARIIFERYRSNPVANPVANPVTNPAADSAADPAADSAANPAADSVGDAVPEELAAVHAVCQRVMVVAPEWRALRRESSVPLPLARFVILQWVASEALLDDLIVDLRGDMTARSDGYLEVFDAIAKDHYRLLLYIVGLSERFLPGGMPSLGDLGEEERQMLVSALEELDAPMSRRSGARLWRSLIAGATGGAALSLGGYDTAAVVAMGSLGTAALVHKAWSERGMYGRQVRPYLAAYLAKVGTPTSCVASWLGQNQQTVKKIKAFNVAIDADAALSAIARLGRMTRFHHGHVVGN